MPGAPDLSAAPEPNASLGRVDFDDSVVVFDRSRGLSHVLNSSAALVWSRLDGTTTVAEIVDDLASSVGVDRATLEPDIITVVDEFRSSGLVDAATTDPPPAPVSTSSWIAVRAGVLDRRPWAVTSPSRRAGGISVRVRSDHAGLGDRLAEILSVLPDAPDELPVRTISIVDRTARTTTPGAGDATAPLVDLRLYVDGELIGRARNVDGAVDQLLTQVNALAIGNTPGRILLHAGAVERDGRVIVVAGVSGRGKSTLTAALVQAGWHYISDEMVAVDPETLWVDPYPKAIDLTVQSIELLGIDLYQRPGAHKEPIPPRALGGVASAGGTLAGIVVLVPDPTDPAPDDAMSIPVELTPMAPVDAVIEVLRNTFDQTMDLPDGLGAVAATCRRIPVFTLQRTDLNTAIDLIDGITG